MGVRGKVKSQRSKVKNKESCPLFRFFLTFAFCDLPFEF